MTSFEELLAQDGKLVYKTKGVSMQPMLTENRDLVIIAVPEGRLKPGDVAFYRRGKDYVLHRVIRVLEDGYLIRGDNTYVLERVPESAVLGVLTAFNRKGKLHRVTEPGYRRYVRLWTALYPLRAFRYRSLGLAKAAARRTGLTPVIKRLVGHE